MYMQCLHQNYYGNVFHFFKLYNLAQEGNRDLVYCYFTDNENQVQNISMNSLVSKSTKSTLSLMCSLISYTLISSIEVVSHQMTSKSFC